MLLQTILATNLPPMTMIIHAPLVEVLEVSAVLLAVEVG
jgi:hypothetical protein